VNFNRLFYLFFALIINVCSLFSQEQDSLSLIKVLKQAVGIEQKVKANIALSKYFLQKNFAKSLEYAKTANTLSIKSDYKEGIASSYNTEGEVNFMLANYEEAKINFTEALSIYKQINHPIGIAESYSGLGKIAYKIGETDAALIHFSEALKIFEKEKHKNALPGVYINIGLLYDEVNNLEQAIEFYNKALTLAKDINDEVSEASCYTNMGSVYTTQGNYKKAINCLERSLEIKKKLGNKKGSGVSLNNLGAVYYEMKNVDKALEYFQDAYNIYIELGDKKSIFPACNNIGFINFEKGNYSKALEYFNKAYDLVKVTESTSKKITCLENLTLVHKALGNTSQALDFSIECGSLKDTLFNKEQTEITAEMQTKFSSEKKQQENEILNLQVKSESFVKTVFIIAAAFLLVLVFFVFRGLKQKQKINSALEEKNKIIEEQKKTVENQKHIVEEQNKDIKDSIRYAERIQSAILPPEQMWNSMLPESFVFYKPKDILSGDFYWIEQKGDLIFVAAADCTGHGVPGALISIVNYNLLNKAVLEKDLNDPADILNYVNNQLILALHQTYQESSVKDGMDISLCVINKKTLELHFAGANNPIYLFKNNELIQISADKFPVGAFVEDKIQYFSSQKVQLQKNDLIYLFSDGYADQFGGEKGKKFKYKQLKNILEENHQLPMAKQLPILEERFKNWQGVLEQVDDVLVIGIRI
jgi:serine phosphatase RsbU (regulator of sigma subunit)/Flp pilus assembly protein TadD